MQDAMSDVEVTTRDPEHVLMLGPLVMHANLVSPQHDQGKLAGCVVHSLSPTQCPRPQCHVWSATLAAWRRPDKVSDVSPPRLSGRDGQVALGWSQAADRFLTLRWTEDGGSSVTTPTRKGFGSRLIARMIGDLKGTTNFEWHPKGLVCEITLQT